MIIQPLFTIFNLSLTTGVVPDDLKHAKVIPIFKGGDSSMFINYRPISLLPCFSKILERIVANRLNIFINKYNILCDSQYGFRANYSTQMALLDLIDKLSSSLDKSNHAIVIFLDLSKAFDTVDDDILISKLNRYGIRGVALNWFKNYLSNRSQFVIWENEMSTSLPITCGVPQGSILGPILFLLYINDIYRSSSLLSFILFADDTSLFYSSANLTQAIAVVNEELCKLSLWFNCNRLSLNLKKTYSMLFTNKCVNMNFDIYLNKTIIKQVNSIKFLGVIIDENITWKIHCDKVHTSTSRVLGILRKLKYILPEKTLFSIYNTLSLPHLQYGILAWGNTCQTYLNKLLIVQKKTLRVINNTSYRAHAAPLFIKNNTLTVFDLYQYHLGVLMYKFDKKALPTPLSTFFTRNVDIHHYNTRSANKLHVNKVRTSFSKSTIRHQGPILWNKLTPLPPLRTIKSFKKYMKRLLLTSNC